MRNREQIYGQEVAGLLRNITVYHCIRHDQLLRLYPGKEDVIENPAALSGQAAADIL